jgi:hypothetical protein
MKKAVAINPVWIAVVAAGKFSYYKSGIMDGCSNHKSISHAVDMVGYGTENGKD